MVIVHSKKSIFFTQHNLRFILFGLPITLMLSACAISQKTSPSRYYVLDALIEPTQHTHQNPLRIGIGPIEIPGYVDRPQMVTRISSSQLQLAEYDRWAEPLEEMFTRTLLRNIKALTGSDSIYGYPWPARLELDYRITAKVLLLENNQAGDAVLSVHWQLIRVNAPDKIKSHYSTYHASAQDNSYPARVTALNDTLAQLAREIDGQLLQ